MKVICVGYRTWALKIFSKLLKNINPDYEVSAVITTKDTEGPYHKLPTKLYVINPAQSSSDELLRLFNKEKPDVALFYGWSWIIPEEIWKNYLCLIYHISPLPKYRGGSPIQHQILKGETKSAGTLFRAVKEIDAGPIYSQTPISLEGPMEDIFGRIVKTGLSDTKRVLTEIAKGKAKPTEQNDKQKTVYKRRKPAESEMTPQDFKTKTAEELYNFIRALGDPYPNAFIVCKDGKKLYFTGAKIDED